MTKYCPSCGSGIEDEAKFCNSCGEEINTVANEDAGDDLSTVGQKSEKSDTSITIGKVAGYLIGAFFALSGLGMIVEAAYTAGVIFIFVGLFAIPKVRENLLADSDITLSKYVVVGIVVVGFIVGSAALPSDFAENTEPTEETSPTGNTPDSDETGERTSNEVNNGGENSAGGGEDSNVYQMGESFVVNDIEYTVNNVRTTSVLQSPISPSEADGVYIIVDLTMTNVGDEATRISNSDITLVDGQGRVHETSSDGMFTYEDTIGILGEQANPGITHEGAVIFDVPPNQENWRLRVTDSSFLSKDEHYFVELSIE